MNSSVERNVESFLDKLKTPYTQENNGNDDTTMKNNKLQEKYNCIQDSHFKRKYLDIVSGNIQYNLTKSMLLSSKLHQNEKLDEQLLDKQKQRQGLDGYIKMMKIREKLPSFKMKDKILDLINGNQVVVISGETGCGKTTQVAQFILDDEIERKRGSITKIICTQPRRISAISVADRVAAERAEELGDSVGYQIRLEKVMCRDYGSILFCTTGLLLQFMQGDPALRDYSHIILDEIHERNTESDFIITLLKQVIQKRSDLKIILMSATLNSERFSKYYNNCPNIHIPGFTYPVDDYYLEDVLELTRFRFPPAPKLPNNYKKHLKKFKEIKNKVSDYEGFIEPALRQMEHEKIYSQHVINELRNSNSEVLNLDLIQSLLEYICQTKKQGAILIFLPGIIDITNLNKNLLSSGYFNSNKFLIYSLHSRLPTNEQKMIFKTPMNGVRKIIIATTIAETSITIEDVVYVIDCGRTKLSRFDVNKNIETLEPEWISIANSKQRRGRAGRVQTGEYYRLYTKAREMTFDQYPTPEMLRTPLDQVILKAKILQLGQITCFLSCVMDPPEDRAIELSLDLLRSLNALDSNENLTPLGYHLAQLPLDPRTGKMILWASMFSCVEPVFSIAASLAFKDAFYCPLGKEDEANKAKLELGMGQYSDHIALAEALRQFERAYHYRNASHFCSKFFLSQNTLKLLMDMKKQFAKYLYDMKFLDSDNPNDAISNRNSNNLAMIKAIVCAGLFPNVAIVKRTGKFPALKTTEDGNVKIHPSSINAKANQLPTPYVTYFLKQKSTAIYLHDTTCVDEAALIFSSSKCSIKRLGPRSQITLNDSISFLCKDSTADMVQKLREELDKLLEYKITHPGTISLDSHGGLVIRAIIELVSNANIQSPNY